MPWESRSSFPDSLLADHMHGQNIADCYSAAQAHLRYCFINKVHRPLRHAKEMTSNEFEIGPIHRGARISVRKKSWTPEADRDRDLISGIF